MEDQLKNVYYKQRIDIFRKVLKIVFNDYYVQQKYRYMYLKYYWSVINLDIQQRYN